MNQFIPFIVGFIALVIGVILGYYARQSIALKQKKTIESKLRKKISHAQLEAEKILKESQEKASRILEQAREQGDERKKELLKAEQILLKKENILNEKFNVFERKEKEFSEKVVQLRKIKQGLETLKEESLKNLEKISNFSQKEAKDEIFRAIEKEYQKEILERINKLKEQGIERFEKRAREIISLAVQKYASSCAAEITSTTFVLPSDEVKGRIIGKEGRNIHTLERLTGTEIIIDDTPESLIISAFDPVRRQIAKIALEKLIQDGRIQPARIEEMVLKAEKEISNQIQEAGETACYDVGIIGLDPKLVRILGRLKFRTSYGQNALLHSIEVAHLASALASEIGANSVLAKKAGFLHDVGKAVDHQIEGSHVEIGMRILEKFGVESEVIKTMRAHHEEYPFENLEAILVQAADAISAARPGARKDNLDNYLKRLKELENIALSYPGVEKAWALQAGRELRIFVKPQEMNDWAAERLAKDIVKDIEKGLKYPGEIKVNVIRETRITEYAK